MNLNKIIKPIERFLKNHWQKWTILVILGMIVYLGSMLYKYVYMPLYQPEEIVIQKLEIQENLYNSLLEKFSQKQKNIIEIFNKNYLDPFQ
ncbi:MAG: hypothetical protein Q8N88_05625 [Nanoarchaeota archaeon]|nr:hypothetical protein [Nanoarchaeota archaeon]